MSAMSLLLTYGLALFFASVLGGSLPRHFAMTHTRTQLAMSLVSGLMLGIAFFHLLPHAVMISGIDRGLNAAMLWAILGLVVMLLLLRLLHFHHPDYVQEPHAQHAHDHAGHSAQHHDHVEALPGGTNSWRGVLLGLSVHSFIDGVALGAALLATPHGQGDQWLGLGVFIAILFHKPLDAMSITALMKASDASVSAIRRANGLFALVCPLGAVLFYLYAQKLGAGIDGVTAAALAFSAGAFLCIALSDLLPEVQFHSHDRLKLSVIFLLGIALAYGMAALAPEHRHGETVVSQNAASQSDLAREVPQAADLAFIASA